MAKFGTHTITIDRGRMAQLILTVRIPRSLRARLRLSVWLMKLAAFISGYTLSLVEEEDGNRPAR